MFTRWPFTTLSAIQWTVPGLEPGVKSYAAVSSVQPGTTTRSVQVDVPRQVPITSGAEDDVPFVCGSALTSKRTRTLRVACMDTSGDSEHNACSSRVVSWPCGGDRA